MVFPRINAALNATLIYYDVQHIAGAVNVISGKRVYAKIKDESGKEMPVWDELILLVHQSMEDEIQQIINLNYPHVRDMVLEDLRDFIETPPIKSVQKERITKLLLDFNASEEERLLTLHPNGFSLGADPAFLPQYFIIVENALNNLKRIVNKYLRLSDAGKFPVTYQTPNYLPANTQPVITDKQKTKKLGLKMTSHQLAVLLRLLSEEDMLVTTNKSEIFRFVSANFELENGEEIISTSFSNNFYKLDDAAKGWWSIRFRKWVDGVKKITNKKPV